MPVVAQDHFSQALDNTLLRDFSIAAVAGAVVSSLLRRIGLPTVAGLIAAGVLVGPYGLRLIGDAPHITTLAEAGVILLLFTIGLEFSLRRLRHIGRYVVLGGALQMILTSVLAYGVVLWWGMEFRQALALALVVAMSSTAIVLRTLAERGESDAPHGRFIIGVLIFQDLLVVPLLLFVPVLAGTSGPHPGLAVFRVAVLSVLLLVATIASGRYLIPPVFSAIEKTRSREAFLLSVLALCLGAAWVASLAGLSLALGAFLAGIMLADSDYSHRALTDVLPLRDVLSSLFFISMGMLFDIRAVIREPGLFASAVVLFLAGKTAAAALAAVLMRFPSRVVWQAAVGLAQFGEFGYVLLLAAVRYGIFPHENVQAVLAAGIVSMFVTPIMMHLAPHVTAGERILRPLARLMQARSIEEANPRELPLRDHVVIAGYGAAGRLLGKALERAGIPFIAIELNAETVRHSRMLGERVYYGDATSPEVLASARTQDARALVVFVRDVSAARRSVEAARRAAPGVPVFVRTAFLAEADELRRLGAHDVACEELAGGLDLADRLFRNLAFPDELRERLIQSMRVRCVVENET
ncbi:MAG: cation:proton antiporter [Bacteroidota bacterium]|nr:cation:proton antiporter [Bacteroidota bacterium]